MFKYFTVALLIAFMALQNGSAKPTAPTEEKTVIDDLANNARELVQSVSHIVDLNSTEITQKLTETSNKLAAKVKEVVTDLNAQANAHQGDVQKVLEDIKTKLSETAASLEKAVGPDAVNKAKSFRAEFDQNLQKTISEAERLGKIASENTNEAKDKLSEIAKSILDQVVETSKKWKTELDKSTASAA